MELKIFIGLSTKISANSEYDRIEECSIHQGAECFEQPAVSDHIGHFGCAFTSVEEHENDQGRIEQLGEQRTEVVPQPKVSAFGQVFPEVIQPDIDELSTEVGDH